MSVRLTEWEIEYLISKIGEDLRRSKTEGLDPDIIEMMDRLYHKIQDANVEMLDIKE